MCPSLLWPYCCLGCRDIHIQLLVWTSLPTDIHHAHFAVLIFQSGVRSWADINTLANLCSSEEHMEKPNHVQSFCKARVLCRGLPRLGGVSPAPPVIYFILKNLNTTLVPCGALRSLGDRYYVVTFCRFFAMFLKSVFLMHQAISHPQEEGPIA